MQVQLFNYAVTCDISETSPSYPFGLIFWVTFWPDKLKHMSGVSDGGKSPPTQAGY